MDGPSDLPAVTPSLLDRLEGSCTLWLRAHHLREGLARRPFHRWRVREPLVDAGRRAHQTMRRPAAADFAPPADLLPEEQASFAAAASGYLEIFGSQPARALDHGRDRPTALPKRGVTVGGAIDLLVENPDGEVELRQFELWRRPIGHSPLDAAEIRLAVLRLLEPLRELGAGQLRVSRADLLARRLASEVVDLAAARPALVTWFDEQLAQLRVTIADAQPRPGSICGMCDFVHRCPAMRIDQ